MTPPAQAAAERDALAPMPLIAGHPTEAQLNTELLSPIFAPTPQAWKMMVGLAAAGTSFLLIGLTVTIARGIGMWGNNQPVGWGFGIINFVWWIGIGHAGTLISAILLLFQQKWRTSINRFAEAMTIFAVMQAGLFPLVHTGRPWFAIYWLFPYPNTMGMWPNFKSPLIWDVFAVSTYLTISLLFWYLGLVPDFATLRDTAKRKTQRIAYGVFALGWKGSSRHWQHYRIGYLILAGLSTPLVLSVHSIVSFDFAVSLLPGWHTTVFPPYFVAGAVFGGFAMVLTLIIPARKAFHFENVITNRHLENMAKVMLVTSMIVGYGYLMENFMAWYGGNPYEAFLFFKTRPTGPYALHLLDDDLLQRGRAPDLLVEEGADQRGVALDRLHPRRDRDVGGAVRDHRDLAPPRLPALLVGHLHPDLGGLEHLLRDHQLLQPALPPLPALRAVGGHRRGEGTEPRDGPRAVARQGARMSATRVILGQYPTIESLYGAARALQDAGHPAVDFYSPYPLPDSDTVLRLKRSPVPFIAGAAGLVGVASAVLMQWWMNDVNFPINVGNRNAVPSPTWVPIMFELGVLLAGVSIFFGLMAIFRFPRPYDPLFEVEAFRSATIDALWLSVAVKADEVPGVSEELRKLGAAQVELVPEEA